MGEVKNKYIFPDFLAKWMSKVDQRTQFEASMMSMSLMAIGLIITITYLIIYMDFAVWYKVLLVINGVAGIVFFWSYLVTTFQQYLTYMEAVDFQNNLKGGNENA
jgi:hypothetical protein